VDGDYLDVVEEEITDLRDRLRRSENADLNGDVVNRVVFNDMQERRRLRLRELEEIRDRAVAAEEADADLRDGRP